MVSINRTVQQAISHDEFARLFAQHHRMLFGYVFILVGSADDAEYLFQEICVRVWQESNSFNKSLDFVAWSTKIAFQEVTEFQKQQEQSFTPEVLQKLSEQTVSQSEIFSGSQSLLPQCVEELSSEEHRVLKEVYAQQHQLSKAAKILKYPLSTLYKALGRIRRKLTKLLSGKVQSEGQQS